MFEAVTNTMGHLESAKGAIEQVMSIGGFFFSLATTVGMWFTGVFTWLNYRRNKRNKGSREEEGTIVLQIYNTVPMMVGERALPPVTIACRPNRRIRRWLASRPKTEFVHLAPVEARRTARLDCFGFAPTTITMPQSIPQLTHRR